MNFFEKIGILLDSIFGFGYHEDNSVQVNNRKDNRLRDEDGRVYTNFQENAEMYPESEDEYGYMYEENNGDYEDNDEYIDYSNGDLSDEDIDYLREEYGEDEY